MMFRVQLQRPAANQGHCRNPFLIKDIWNIPPTRMLVREWVFEAKNEREVRRLLAEARAAGLDSVRGYHLKSIEALAP